MALREFNPTGKLEVQLDTEELERQVAAIRLCLSQIGFALDTLLLSLSEDRSNAKGQP